MTSLQCPVYRYPDIFLSGLKNVLVHMHVSVLKSSLPVHTYPTRIWIQSFTQDSLGILATENAS